MNTIRKFLVACTAVALPFASASLPLPAVAQTDDAAYCAALSKAYRDTSPKTESPGVEIPVAMAKCAEGDTAGGIPVLEKALKDTGVTLPGRRDRDRQPAER